MTLGDASWQAYEALRLRCRQRPAFARCLRNYLWAVFTLCHRDNRVPTVDAARLATASEVLFEPDDRRFFALLARCMPAVAVESACLRLYDDWTLEELGLALKGARRDG